MNHTTNDVSLKYDNTTKMLYGDVDGVSTPFQGYLLMPDYSRQKYIVQVNWGTETHNGETLEKNADHFWLNWDNGNHTWTWDPNEKMSWAVPENGYINCAFYSIFKDGKAARFTVCIKRNNGIAVAFDGSLSTNARMDMSSLVPVRKGDIVYWGAASQVYTPTYLANYSIRFYPCVKELS